VKPAIFGNVGTLVTFRVGAEDADFLEKEFSPEFMATDLVNAGKHNFYIKLMIDGVASRPFSAQNLDFLSHAEGEESFKELIIDQSRNKYGIPRVQIERKIIDRWSETGEKMEEKASRKTEQSIDKLLRPVRPKKEVVLDELRVALDKAISSDEPPPVNLDEE
jgi:hypothetical protein